MSLTKCLRQNLVWRDYKVKGANIHLIIMGYYGLYQKFDLGYYKYYF